MASAAHAVEANLFSLFKQLGGWRRLELHDDRDCFWTISDVRFPLFNSVMRVRVESGDVDRLIDDRISSCRERNVPMLWWTGPSTSPAELPSRLEARGFLLEPAYGMAADLSVDRPADSGLTVEPVEDAATLSAWMRVLCGSFGAPSAFGDAFTDFALSIGLGRSAPFRHFLGRINGEAVATCSLFIADGVGGIYDVGTLPERRRRGFGAAMTQAAMQEAKAVGCHTAILHSSALGAGVYRSLGFEDVCDIGQYVWAPGLS